MKRECRVKQDFLEFERDDALVLGPDLPQDWNVFEECHNRDHPEHWWSSGTKTLTAAFNSPLSGLLAGVDDDPEKRKRLRYSDKFKAYCLCSNLLSAGRYLFQRANLLEDCAPHPRNIRTHVSKLLTTAAAMHRLNTTAEAKQERYLVCLCVCMLTCLYVHKPQKLQD